MALCTSTCATLPPTPAGRGCERDYRPGGIKALVFFDCSVALPDVRDKDAWCAGVKAGKIRMTGPLSAQKPAGSAVKQQLDSCSPETTTGMDRTLTFTDYNADDKYGTDIRFWRAIQRNPSRYRFGWLTCDGIFYGPIDNFAVEVDEIIPQNSNEYSSKQGTLTWRGLDMVEPVYIDGLESILLGECTPAGPGTFPQYFASVMRIGDTPVGPGAAATFYADQGVDTDNVPIHVQVDRLPGCNGAITYTFGTLPAGFTSTQNSGSFAYDNSDYQNTLPSLPLRLSVADSVAAGSYTIPINFSGCTGPYLQTVNVTVIVQ